MLYNGVENEETQFDALVDEVGSQRVLRVWRMFNGSILPGMRVVGTDKKIYQVLQQMNNSDVEGPQGAVGDYHVREVS